jgi:hypothetical protein
MTKKDKLNRLAKAANALRTAADAMRQIQDDKSDNHYICEDARFYLTQIQELISCDHGQAGLDALIHKVNQQVS